MKRVLLFAFLAGCAAAEEPPQKKVIAPRSMSIGPEKRISETEDVRTVRLPGARVDTVCLIYRNTEFRTAQWVCPDGTDFASLD